MNLPKAIICDLDGCLADHRHRLHFVDWAAFINKNFSRKSDPVFIEECKVWGKNWDAYFAGIPDDGVNEWCKTIMYGAPYMNCAVLTITGRPERFRQITYDWFTKKNLKYSGGAAKLFMRPDFLPVPLMEAISNPMSGRKLDTRPAHEVKREIYEREIRDKYDVLFVIEDNEECARMYRDLGLVVLRVI